MNAMSVSFLRRGCKAMTHTVIVRLGVESGGSKSIALPDSDGLPKTRC